MAGASGGAAELFAGSLLVHAQTNEEEATNAARPIFSRFARGLTVFVFRVGPSNCLIKHLLCVREGKPAGQQGPASFRFGSKVNLSRHNDKTKARRSALCAAVSALNALRAAVAWPA